MDAPEGMVLIPGGDFSMGNEWDDVKTVLQSVPWTVRCMWLFSPRQRALLKSQCPPHPVSLAAYYMDQYPVTNARYKAFVEATGHRVPYIPMPWAASYNWDVTTGAYPNGRGDHPVTMVSWEDAQAYCSWASKRLPMEAEWERAARGTEGRYWPWGNAPDTSFANTREAGPRDTTPVGQYSNNVSPGGCYDMSGNIKEWCSTAFNLQPTFRVVRGGGWGNYIALASCTFREARDPRAKNESLGFRCVLGKDD